MHDRTIISAALLCLIAGTAHAEGPRISAEIERERDRDRGVWSNSVTLKPGWDFGESSIIDRVELILERSLDEHADATGSREHETSALLRIRHSGKITESLGYYLRGAIGRSFGNESTFTFGYIEPGVKYEFADKWEWLLGFREIHALDGTPGEHVHKLITGPSYKVTRDDEVQLRYTTGWGDQRLRALSVEYARKF